MRHDIKSNSRMKAVEGLNWNAKGARKPPSLPTPTAVKEALNT